VNGQDEKDGDLYSGMALAFLLQNGALWSEWTLVVHFQMALLRMSFEVLVEFVRFAPGFCLKKPQSKIFMFRVSLHCCVVTVLPFMLGVPPWTPLPIDFTAWQKTSPRCSWFRK
jgi:hypothetical protein